MTALAERKIIPHEELVSRSERKAEQAAEPELRVEFQANAEVEDEPEVEADSDSLEAAGDVEPEAEASIDAIEAEAETEIEADSHSVDAAGFIEPEAEASDEIVDVEAEPEVEADSDSVSNVEPEAEADIAADAEFVAAPDVEADSNSVDAAGFIEPEAESEAEIVAEARPDHFRLLEALLFAASEPIDEKALGSRLPEGVDVRDALRALQLEYAPRGVNLVKIGGAWTFRTASDLSWLLTKEQVVSKKLSRAAIETLAVIAYHQPVTRVEIEEIRGVAMSKGTFDVLMETGWIRPRGRRKTPGRPITYGTSEGFLEQFGLETLGDLPGLEELKGSGLLDGRLPPGFAVPLPSDDPELRDDEDPLDPGDLDLGLAPPADRLEQ